MRGTIAILQALVIRSAHYTQAQHSQDAMNI